MFIHKYYFMKQNIFLFYKLFNHIVIFTRSKSNGLNISITAKFIYLFTFLFLKIRKRFLQVIFKNNK